MAAQAGALTLESDSPTEAAAKLRVRSQGTVYETYSLPADIRTGSLVVNEIQWFVGYGSSDGTKETVDEEITVV